MAVLELRAQDRGEEPGADDVVRLRAHVHRKHLGEEGRVLEPAARHVRRERRGGPGVHHVGVAGEAARLVPLVRPVAIGHVGRRIDRQPRLVGQQRLRVVDRPVRANRIPHRKRHAEESLAADAPVAGEAVHPVLEPVRHVLRVPLQLAAAGQERIAELHRLDEPLPAGDDLERPITLLVELHRVRDRARVADQVAALAQQLDDARARFRRRQTGQLIVGALRRGGVARRPPLAPERHRLQRSVGLDDGTHRQRQLAPPGHVGEVAERADHGDAAALLGIGQRMRLHRHRHPKSGVTTSLPKSG